MRAMQAGAFGIRHGKTLVLFPDERSTDGTPKMFKKGAAILSAQLGLPIVPVAIHCVTEGWPRGRSFNWRALLPWVRTRMRLTFGVPLSPDLANEVPGERRYTALTDRLRREVVMMWLALDEQMR